MICVGVDAGGTSTVAALSEDGEFRRVERGPGANATTLGVDDAADAVIGTIRAVLAGAKPTAIHVGAAGSGRPRIAAALRDDIASAFPHAHVAVGDDAAIALRGAIPHGDGAVLIAGTGSVAYAEHGDRMQRVGGLGYLAGDEGSGFWIGMQAVKLYGRVLDGRAQRDETTDLAARALGVSDRDGLLDALYDAPLKPAQIAALAPSIIAFAGKGNRASTKIVQQAASELGDLLKSVLRTSGLLEATPQIALSGGLLEENSLLTFLLETRLNGDVPGVTIVKGKGDAARGALRLAERAAEAAA
ncbi:MAG: ATPase, BadF/BadG/BcrA/BcrD type [Candidatus Eremiobacteraeota bacterium]|nr:ATPase, BadF/BadG/BcrA/BcrD type [Candidatus Eremiobacteraeota bacterium]